MKQEVLNTIGMVGFGLLLIGFVWCFVKLRKLDQIRGQFFSSGIKKDLEQVLVDQNRVITKNTQDLEHLANEINNLFTVNKINLQKVGFVRFNPFDDAGGNISFVVALLNAHSDGVVISSLHGREGTRVYAKEIKAGQSESKLTTEEIQAIQQAK
jgi:hypothetical protein